MQFFFLLEQVVNGLVLGGYYLLIALGLSLIFSVGGVVNLAHGAFYALGAYFSLEIAKLLGFGPAVVLSPVAVALLGILFERFLLRRFYTADPILSLLVTFGLALVAEQAIRMIWGAAPLPFSMPQAFKGNVTLGDFLFSRYRLFLLAVVALVLTGIWPTVWHHDLDTPGSQAFVAAFRNKYGKPPENHAWIEYVSLKIMAQAMNATKSTDTEKLIAYFESQAEFDLLKARKGYFRSWDHQLIQEAYPFTVKPKGQAKDKWDILAFGAAVPAANQPLESINPPKEANACVL